MHAVDGDVAAGLAQIVGERHLVQRVAKPVGEDQRDVAGLEGMSRAHVRFTFWINREGTSDCYTLFLSP